MDSIWRGSNSLLHMSWLTCREAGKTGKRRRERRKLWLFFLDGTFFFFCDAGGNVFCLLNTDVVKAGLSHFLSTSPPLPGPVHTICSMCRSGELKSTHDVILAFWLFFFFYHHENCTLWNVYERKKSIRECVSVSHFCCLQTWSIVPNGDLICSWDFWASWETAFLQPGLDPTLWKLTDLHQTLGLGFVLHTVVTMSFFLFFFKLVFIIFFYIKPNVCTYQWSLRNCTKQTGKLASCAVVAKW